MRKTIRGVVYDTETAVWLDRRQGHMSPELDNWEAELYKTPISGRYFLYGYGDLMTIFRGKERIIPLSEEEAARFIG